MDYSFLAARLTFTFIYTCIFFSWQINSAAAAAGSRNCRNMYSVHMFLYLSSLLSLCRRQPRAGDRKQVNLLAGSLASVVQGPVQSRPPRFLAGQLG